MIYNIFFPLVQKQIATPGFTYFHEDFSTTFLRLFSGGGGGKSPVPNSFVNNFFCQKRMDLKILDFLSYTLTQPIQLNNSENFDYSIVAQV